MLLEIFLSRHIAAPAVSVRLSGVSTCFALVMFVARIEAFALGHLLSLATGVQLFSRPFALLPRLRPLPPKLFRACSAFLTRSNSFCNRACSF